MASPQATSPVEPTYQIANNVTDHEEGYVTVVKDRAFVVLLLISTFHFTT